MWWSVTVTFLDQAEGKMMESLNTEEEIMESPCRVSFPKLTPASDYICSLVCS